MPISPRSLANLRPGNSPGRKHVDTKELRIRIPRELAELAREKGAKWLAEAIAEKRDSKSP